MTADKPILQLAPHENPLRRRTDMDGEAVFFEAKCFGRVREFVGQSISEDGYGNILFFQLEDEPQRGKFVYSGKDGNWGQPYMDYGKTSSIRSISYLEACVESNAWGRYFVLDPLLELADASNGNNTLFLNWNGLGMFHQDGGGFARFRWSEPCVESLWNAPIKELLGQFVTQFGQQGSEPQFALWWASLSDLEQLNSTFPLARESYQQWKNVCRLLPTALIAWPDDYFGKLYVSFDVERKLVAKFFNPRDPAPDIDSSALERLWLWLHDYFSPQRGGDTRYLCIRQFLQRKSHYICDVTIERPTQHERLEALLQLRDWLRDKAAPAEIEALLRAD